MTFKKDVVLGGGIICGGVIFMLRFLRGPF